MTLAEAAEIFTYWERNPPVYHLTAIIAQILGWKPQRDEDRGLGAAAEAEPVLPPLPSQGATPDLQSLMAVPGVAVQRMPEWAKGAILDFAELSLKHRANRDGS